MLNRVKVVIFEASDVGRTYVNRAPVTPKVLLVFEISVIEIQAEKSLKGNVFDKGSKDSRRLPVHAMGSETRVRENKTSALAELGVKAVQKQTY